MNIIPTIIFLLVFVVGGVFLQIFLSKKNNKFLGLILPIISFLFSILYVLSVAVFNWMTKWEVFGALVGTFILSNIPTIILLAIYFGCKEKNKRKKKLEKMNIQDLD